MSAFKKIVVISCCCFLVSCSSYKMATLPTHKQMKEIEIGDKRDHIISTFGQPEKSELQIDKGYKDYYRLGAEDNKILSVAGTAANAIFTLGVYDIIQSNIISNSSRYILLYDNQGNLISKYYEGHPPGSPVAQSINEEVEKNGYKYRFMVNDITLLENSHNTVLFLEPMGNYITREYDFESTEIIANSLRKIYCNIYVLNQNEAELYKGKSIEQLKKEHEKPKTLGKMFNQIKNIKQNVMQAQATMGGSIITEERGRFLKKIAKEKGFVGLSYARMGDICQFVQLNITNLDRVNFDDSGAITQPDIMIQGGTKAAMLGIHSGKQFTKSERLEIIQNFSILYDTIIEKYNLEPCSEIKSIKLD